MKNVNQKIEALMSFYGTTQLAIKTGLLKTMKSELVNDINELKPELLEELTYEINKGEEIKNISEKVITLQIINEINEKALKKFLPKTTDKHSSKFMKDTEYLHELTMDLQKMLLKGE